MTLYRAVIWARDAMHAPDCALSTAARLLLYELAAHADEAGTCRPSVQRLAEGLAMHPGNVRRARAELVAAGLIAVDIKRGRGHANTYRFPFVAHPSTNGDRPPINGKKPRVSARLSNPQTARQRAVSPSTNRASARGTYPQTARDLSTNRANTRGKPRTSARPSSKRSSKKEVARVASTQHNGRATAAERRESELRRAAAFEAARAVSYG